MANDVRNSVTSCRMMPTSPGTKKYGAFEVGVVEQPRPDFDRQLAAPGGIAGRGELHGLGLLARHARSTG